MRDFLDLLTLSYKSKKTIKKWPKPPHVKLKVSLKIGRKIDIFSVINVFLKQNKTKQLR